MVKQSFTGKDWDDVSIKTKYEAAHNMPPTWWQYLWQIFENANIPILIQQLGLPHGWLGFKGERKAGTNISVPKQVMGARAVNTAVSNPKKSLQQQKYEHDLELQKEAKRQHKTA
jgi:hypothetical protein